MATTDGKMVTYREELPPMNSHKPLNMWSLKVTMVALKITMPMITKLVRVVSYWEETYKAHGHKTRQVADLP